MADHSPASSSEAAASQQPPSERERLNVIALVSGGKDSFFSLLHCMANGHRVVALANLHPAEQLRSTLGDLANRDLSWPGTVSAGSSSSTILGRSSDDGPLAAAAGPAPAGASTMNELVHDGAAHGSLPTAPGSGTGPARDRAEQLSGLERQGRTGGPDGGTSDSRGKPLPIVAVAEGNDRDVEEEDSDLNSFMYQTVGHEVIPLYEEATGIPLFRRAIVGAAVRTAVNYSHLRDTSTLSSAHTDSNDQPTAAENSARGSRVTRTGSGQAAATADGARSHDRHNDDDDDETESMIPLLLAAKAAHPEANALCAGAILSTYQRTRVESVAIRLGLVPLAYLWKFPVLPPPSLSASPHAQGSSSGKARPADATQLLADMAAAGVDARVIKVASGGLDDGFLWINVASDLGRARLSKAMNLYGAEYASSGAALGEGGEFETLVVDGPPALFRQRIVIAEEDRKVVQEGGGTAWLKLRRARLERKQEASSEAGAAPAELNVRIPDLLDDAFRFMLSDLKVKSGELPDGPVKEDDSGTNAKEHQSRLLLGEQVLDRGDLLLRWSYIADEQHRSSIETETKHIVESVLAKMSAKSLEPAAIISSLIVLRKMSDFPIINSIYGSMFSEPLPPSRVTISCGDGLPPDCNIAVYLTLSGHSLGERRKGLHVQSRSYWAPANIGPYSQAITVKLGDLAVPVSGSHVTPKLSLLHIAGQIPLIPATMDLPRGPDSLELSIALSLQHLWRIGAEMSVQWWTSAVAYFPRCTTDSPSMRLKALLAAVAWNTANMPLKDDDDGSLSAEDDDFDIWDKKFNSSYGPVAGMGDDDSQATRSLPDWLVTTGDTTGAARSLPPVFAAEVEELPRQAQVEWHAHLGLADVEPGSVTQQTWHDETTTIHHVHVRDATADESVEASELVQTIVALHESNSRQYGSAADLARQLAAIVHEGLYRNSDNKMEGVGGTGPASHIPSYVYVDSARCAVGAEDIAAGMPLIPCRSLWDAQGRRLSAVSVFHSFYSGESIHTTTD